MYYFKYFVFFVCVSSFSQELTIDQANHLASLPVKCLQQEYPNKLGQMLIDSTEIQNPKKLHPSFYGCFDWHSSVHGHWSLVFLLKKFPILAQREAIIKKLQVNLSKENVQTEIEYLSKKHEKSFERTYGWNWLLKLQLELETYNEPFAQELAQNLKPLSNLIIERYIEFLPKLLYPIRVGTHSNTAFGLTFAWDYAVHSNNVTFQNSIRDNSIRLFQNDVNCPFNWEPSGTDFLSPCLEEMGLMQRVLNQNDFLKWLKKFAPQLFNKKFKWEVAKVSDRTDGHLVHLDGLNFSRAWNLYHLINAYPKQFGHLKSLADGHMNFSLPSVVDGNYEGEHWLASFALHAYEEKK
jgi:Protein of unknown function (DUF2891)